MTKVSTSLTSLLHRLGVGRRVRLDASAGTRAPKISQGTSPSFTSLTNLVSLGHPTAAKTFTRFNNLVSRHVMAGKQARRGNHLAQLRSLITIPFLFSLLMLPASASAYATLEGPPQFSSAPGLPDGRAYEQVSPADKSGNEAGGSTTTQFVGAVNRYGLASADGNAVLFEGTGPIGESPSGAAKWFVATKKAGEPGWSTRSLLPAVKSNSLGTGLSQLDPSSDLSHAMVESGYLLASEDLCPTLFLTGPNPFLAATWLGQTELANPVVRCHHEDEIAPAGGTPDFSTVYFTYAGTLLPQDVSRAPHAAITNSHEEGEAWGFYENHEGELREAGVLPGESVSPPFGAVPAASGHGRNPSGNEVSADGSRAFFVSPDPASCEHNGTAYPGHNDCATDPPELYVRENGAKTTLVSQSQLPGNVGEPAPGGVLRMPNRAYQHESPPFVGSYVFASPDGSQAFFQSASALTQAAEEASPGSEPKTYDFDVDTDSLEYLPDVVLAEGGEILATDGDGSTFAFVRPEAGGEPAQLELWSAGANGGSVIPVRQLPEPGASVLEAHMSSDGLVLVFQTASQLSGAFNSGAGVEQIYRYDVPSNTLGCVSCAPAGVTPGGASMSALRYNENINDSSGSGVEDTVGAVDERGISADGDRIFFDSADPLVPQDTNTNSPEVAYQEEEGFRAQGRDVYEWENGVVYLISTGKSPRDSYLIGSSENGDDVFFSTAEGLVPGDTDGGYDVYDARVPHEGEPLPPAAVPCEGAVCQGPPNVPSPLTPPASATFADLGNPAPEVTPLPPPAKTTTKTVKCKKIYVKNKKNKCIKKHKAKKSAKRSK